MPADKPRASKPRRAAPAATAVIAPSGLKSWHTCAFLIVTALIWYWLKWPFIIISTLVAVFVGLFWLGQRFPRTMFVIARIINALLIRR
ncbi:hypothetical protein CQ14_06990 [Bradyrhizobium lablabi]|uniref:Uncharacterized protein n=1 Tax=Bradyrhizobium lablabi TaxID=722472 RepID=A0A0R3MUA7_9BRAD|nr:hypothetical protein [Bradyrhizobium lablabi]KRR21389.1 hypothetical protein CQ14_06990 [Bradyrhizobium lablabi]